MKILLCFVLLSVFSITDDTDRVEWSKNYRLQFKDFQGTPDDSIYAGLSDIQMEPVYYLSTGISSYSVKCFFYRSYSWLKIFDSSLLLHEQGHFDLGEVRARGIRRYLFSVQDTEIAIINDRIQRMDPNYLDSIYDLETVHGSDSMAQDHWNKRINKMLDSLKDYSSPADTVMKVK